MGIVSIGDLVKNRLDEVEFEANSLRIVHRRQRPYKKRGAGGVT